MDVLEPAFPHIPRSVLRSILEQCGGAAQAAFERIRRNEWPELDASSRNSVGESDLEVQTGANSSVHSPGQTTVESHEVSNTATDLETLHGMISTSESESEDGEQNLTENTTRETADGADTQVEALNQEEEDEVEDEEDEQEYIEVGEEQEERTPVPRDEAVRERIIQDLIQRRTDVEHFQLIDDLLYHSQARRRVQKKKITPTNEAQVSDTVKRYWVRFDDQVMLKSHLELLNITLKSTAHRSVALLNLNAKVVSEEEALDKLTKFSSFRLHNSLRELRKHSFHPRSSNARQSTSDSTTVLGKRRPTSPHNKPHPTRQPNKAARIGSGDVKSTVVHSGPRPEATCDNQGHGLADDLKVSEKPYKAEEIICSVRRNNVEGPDAGADIGFWAHVFDVNDIDEIWRYMCNSHITGRSFGDVFEITSCKITANGSVDDFSELSSSSRRNASCAVLVPCAVDEAALHASGSALSKTLILREPIHFRFRSPTESVTMNVHRCLERGDCKCRENCFKKVYGFFEVLSKDDHILASQYRLSSRAQPPRLQSEEIERHSWGSFRLRPPNHQHADPAFQLSKISGVVWKPIN